MVVRPERHLIRWFWEEFWRFENLRPFSIPAYIFPDGLCQCSTDNAIEYSSDPDRMRAFWLIGVTIDQMMYTHFNVSGSHPSPLVRRSTAEEGTPIAIHRQKLYAEFLDAGFRFPKLYAHGWIGMASPASLVYGREREAGWCAVSEVSGILLGGLYRWFDMAGEQKEKHRFQKYLEVEVFWTFDSASREKLLPILDGLMKSFEAKDSS